jgi:hypothetical protein
MVMTYQTCLQINRVTGDCPDRPQFIKILVHDLSPTLTAMMLALGRRWHRRRDGSMKVTEQTMPCVGRRAGRHLIVPRFLASVIATVVLTVFGGGRSSPAATANAVRAPGAYYDLSPGSAHPPGPGLSKAIAHRRCHPHHLRFLRPARQGSPGVGWATTAAILGSSLP